MTYRTTRSQEWNYGGRKWKLSRSKIELFLECPHCFYLDNIHGLKRVPSFPLSLNNHIDALLKKEFDYYRARNEQPPLLKEFNINARPTQHEDLEMWRDNFTGCIYYDHATGMKISGALDDLWINDRGEYCVVDYKATAGKTRDEIKKQGLYDSYKRQLEIYQWILQKNGLNVSNEAYILYVFADATQQGLKRELAFDYEIISHTGNTDWIQGCIDDIYDCLEGDIPKPSPHCDYCKYFARRSEVK